MAAVIISTVIIVIGGATYLNIGIALLLLIMAGGISFTVGYSLENHEELRLLRMISSLNSKLEEIKEKINIIDEKISKIEKLLEE